MKLTWYPAGMQFRGLWAVLAVTTLGAAQAPPPDVIVVGAGIAGLTTALEAARGGARVAVVDIASVFGGHAVVSEGGLCLVGTPLQESLGSKDSPDLAYQDFLHWGEDANAAWARMYVDRSRRDVHDWLTAMGVPFDRLIQSAGNSAARFHQNPRRGFGIVEPVYRNCLESGRVTFYWNTRVNRLLRSGDRVSGLEGVNLRTRAAFSLSAKAVVLATGGFQSNLKLVRENWPPGLAFPSKILVGAGVNAMGSGLDLARAQGALIERLDHQWNYPRGVPDPRYSGTDRGLHVINRSGIWLNSEGRRFMNEDESASVMLQRMLAQPEGKAWLVFDSVGRGPLFVAGSDWADPKRVDEVILNNPALAHKADSLRELAGKAGWPFEPFRAAVERYNAFIAQGEDSDFRRFDASNPPTARPGRAALEPVAKPPFYAVPMYPMTRKSMGGVAVDLECRVLDARRRPIPGLYAAGEVTGFNGINGKAGLEGTFIGPSILQGRILGKTLAALGGGSAAAPPPAVQSATGKESNAPCAACHALARQVRAAREGYWHFERVHQRVLERGWDCTACHAELSPFRAAGHKTDPVKQLKACERCHLGTD